MDQLSRAEPILNPSLASLMSPMEAMEEAIAPKATSLSQQWLEVDQLFQHYVQTPKLAFNTP